MTGTRRLCMIAAVFGMHKNTAGLMARQRGEQVTSEELQQGWGCTTRSVSLVRAGRDQGLVSLRVTADFREKTLGMTREARVADVCLFPSRCCLLSPPPGDRFCRG